MKLPENKPCSKCREKGGDSTGDHLYRAYEGTKPLAFYICRKCGHQEWLSGSKKKPEAPEEFTATRLSDLEISKLPSLPARGITDVIRKLYGVTTECSVTSGLATHHYYPMTKEGSTLCYKVRDIEKKKAGEAKAFGRTKSGVTSDIDLFGMQSLKGTPRTILITEGEEDAMAAHQMLRDKVFGISCLSLTDGTGSVQGISRRLEWLNKAHEIYFCPDGDEAGQKLVEKVVALLPDVKIVSDMKHKDANAMLEGGQTDAFRNCFNRAKKWTPPFLVRVSDVKKEACTLPTWGRSWPWPTLNKLTYGMRDGEGMFVGAGVKIGKSEFLNELIKHRINAKDGDIPACAKFEELPPMTVKKMAGKMDGCMYHKPDVPFLLPELEMAVENLDNKMLMYKAFGQADWDMVKLWIRYVVGEGSKTIIIDPVTKLTNHLTSSETETELRRISDELACMAQDLGFFYIVTCHLKAPAGGKTPHERGGKVESNQFRGSRAMMENCYYMVGVERNKDPEITMEERNTSTFVLLDDRSFGNTGRFQVHYSPLNGDYLEGSGIPPHTLGGS